MQSPSINALPAEVVPYASSETCTDALKARSPRQFFVLLCAVLFFYQWLIAGYVVVSKHAFSSNINPLIFSLVRDTCATPLLLLNTCLADGSPAVAWRHIPRLAVLGATGIFGSQFFFAIGVKLTTSSEGGAQ